MRIIIFLYYQKGVNRNQFIKNLFMKDLYRDFINQRIVDGKFYYT
jgi:hypothetical protein